MCPVEALRPQFVQGSILVGVSEESALSEFRVNPVHSLTRRCSGRAPRAAERQTRYAGPFTPCYYGLIVTILGILESQAKHE